MNSYDFILFCFTKHLFSLYICLVIFIFRLRVREFPDKINVVTANVNKPLAVFRLDDLCSLKYIKCFPQEWCIMGLETNFSPSVFFLFSSSAPQLTGWRVLRHSLPGAKTNASMTTVQALLLRKETFSD